MYVGLIMLFIVLFFLQMDIFNVTYILLFSSEKPGVCPAEKDIDQRHQSCQDDEDCAGRKKCCRSDDGSLRCASPLREREPKLGD